jgi:uncharacterized protein (TIGR02391 family)
MEAKSRITRLESLITEAGDGQPPDRDLWRERARAELVDYYGDPDHKEVKRFEAAVFPGLVRSPQTVRSGQFAQAEQKATRRGAIVLQALTEQLKRKEADTGQSVFEPASILDRLHPSIRGASGKLYLDGHFGSAIFEAFKAVEARVRDLSGLDETGRSLMVSAFNENNPTLPLNHLNTRTEIDEQEGFRFIFMGASQGIRNPKAHDIVEQEDPERTLDYLSLASLLMRRLDDAEALL